SPSLPDPKPMNANLALYRDAIRAIAEKRGHYFADLHNSSAKVNWIDSNGVNPRSDNGMHLTEEGYRVTAGVFMKSLGVETSLGGTSKWTIPEPLRAAVIAKNELFFHRWRPQNATYL